MRTSLLFAALGLAGCGVIYTSPDVYESGAPGRAGTADADVQVVPLTFETALEANLDEYVPARLPEAFRPAPTRTPGAVGVSGARMPDLPELDAAAMAEATGEGDPLPPAATARETAPDEAPAVNLPAEQEPQPYRIGVADMLLLSTDTSGATLEEVPSLITAQSSRQGYVVQDDGAIAIPDVGRVRVAGMTLEEAEAEIFNALVEQQLDPSFSLEIAEFNSKRVSVGGAVRQPGVQPITLKPLYLSEALQFSGGLAAQDLDHAVVRLFRDGETFQAPARRIFGETGLNDVLLEDGDAVFVDADYDVAQARAYFEEQLRLRQARLAEREFEFRRRQARIDEVRFQNTLAQFELQKAQLRQQIAQMRMQAADFEIARNTDRRQAAAEARETFKDRVELGAVARDYAYLAGEVRRPSRMALPFETRLTMADLLFENQAVNINFADYGAIYLLRRDPAPEAGGAVTAYRLNASNAANLTTAAAMELRPDDVVFVAEQPVTAWNRVISQLTPNLLGQAAAVSNAAGN